MTEVTVSPGAFRVEVRFNKITQKYKVVPLQYHDSSFNPSVYVDFKPGVYVGVMSGQGMFGLDTLGAKSFKTRDKALKYASYVTEQGIKYIASLLSQEEVDKSWTTLESLRPVHDLPGKYNLTMEQWEAIRDSKNSSEEDE